MLLLLLRGRASARLPAWLAHGRGAREPRSAPFRACIGGCVHAWAELLRVWPLDSLPHACLQAAALGPWCASSTP